MDSIINAALEEICARGSIGIPISDLFQCMPINPSDSIKKSIWIRLLSLPTIKFNAYGSSIDPNDSKIQSLGEAEKLGLQIIADETIRDCFMGIDDLNAATAKIPDEQRRTLERVGAARTNGITQCELAKEFHVKETNFFYQVRNLESRQLITRQSTIVREKKVGNNVEKELTYDQILNTNLIHLYRYAKTANLNSQQRIEITKAAWSDMLENVGNADDRSAIGDVFLAESVKEDMLIKDYLPAMKSVCDELEEADNKVLVVSDIKPLLGYRFTPGHRAWRNIINRLEEAGLVRKFRAQVNGKDVQCLHLLKKFDPKDFQSKAIVSRYDGFDPNNLVKLGKRRHNTDQFLELPMEQCIYDMVDAEGHEGITVVEVCKRLGLSSKKMYKRIRGMCSRFGMCMESEKPDKTVLYRIWTRKNYKQRSINATSGNCQGIPITSGLSSKSSDLVPYGQSSSNAQLLDSSFNHKDLPSQKPKAHSAQEDFQLLHTCDRFIEDSQVIVCGTVPQNLTDEFSIADNDAKLLDSSFNHKDLPSHKPKAHSAQEDFQLPHTCDRFIEDSQVTVCGTVPQNLTDEFSIVDNDAKLGTAMNTICPGTAASESPLSVSPMTSKKSQWYRSFGSTALGAKREQRILERLKDDKFILYGDLYRWLKDLEKDKHTTMDRKTLDRTLNRLKQEGLCKITQVFMPAVTNFNRTIQQGLILHPSVDNLSSDQLNQIYNSYKYFELQSHSRESGRLANQPVPVLTGVKRSSNCIDDKPILLEAMRANGYVQAKMVRAKLLHLFLWGYISSLPDWKNNIPSTEDSCKLMSRCKTCQFTMGVVVEAMPLELFLQIVGSAKEIDDMVQRCRLGLRLKDLPVKEKKSLLDTQATGRLSRIIDILLRLKLIQLVWKEPAGVDLQPHALPMHTLELKPYIEEPLPRVPPSLKIDSLDLRPRIRHDFVFSNMDDVTAYWETLEYCYAAADPDSAALSFPGSVVNEVFYFRSWISIRVMTTAQRMELLKRMEIDHLEKKIPFKECVQIARELNLSVEQVLRVSYDKQQRRSQRVHTTLKSKDQEKCTGTNYEPVVKKRRSSKDESAVHVDDAATQETSYSPTMFIAPHADGNNINIDSSLVTGGTQVHDNPVELEACMDNRDGSSAVEPEPPEDDDQSLSFIRNHAFSLPKPIRQRRFTWNDKFDRQIVMEYAKHRVIMGEKHNGVSWSSIHDLPTYPLACGRRMNKLKSDNSTRRAIMRLCNLLGQRYGMYLQEQWRTLGENTASLDDSAKSILSITAEKTIDQNMLGASDDSPETSLQQNRWDDYEDPDIKMAIDEVLRCKRMAKLESTNRIGSRHGQGWPDAAAEGTKLDFQEHVMSMEHRFVSSGLGDKNDSFHETGDKISNILPTTTQSRSNSYNLHRKFMKLSNTRGVEIQRQVWESMTVANAVELLKVVFLSNSSTPEIQTSLAETLKLYPKCDLIAAFNYLKERDFVVVGNGSRPPLLSQKFWHSASSSPFPIDSGKRAVDFSNWLHEQDKCLEDGIDLSMDIQCGEIFQLLALVSTEEIFVSPVLPEKGIGEADDSKSSQSLLVMDDEIKCLKRRSDKVELSDCNERDKKHKSQWKVDSDFCSRREKGFPGIKVVVNRATIPRVEALQCSTDGQNNACFSPINRMNLPDCSDMETIFSASSLSGLSFSDNFGKGVQSGALGEPQFDQMTKYAEHLISSLVGRFEAFTFCPELFRSVCYVIDQAGERGLTIEEISRVMSIQGLQLAEVMVDTLEVFQLAFKVTAFDSVRVVSSSYRSKYFIGLHVNHNQQNFISHMVLQGMSYERAQHIYQGKLDNINNSKNDTSMSLSDGHKMTLLDLPPKPSQPVVETQLNGENVASDQQDAVSGKSNESGNRLLSAFGVPNMYQSILPWINGDGSTNTIMYRALTRRVIGTLMQNPGMIEEDIIQQMSVLNPQSCRRLLETMILDNHITTKMMYQTVSTGPPLILRNLFYSDIGKPKAEIRKHYFANPMSTFLL